MPPVVVAALQFAPLIANLFGHHHNPQVTPAAQVLQSATQAGLSTPAVQVVAQQIAQPGGALNLALIFQEMAAFAQQQATAAATPAPAAPTPTSGS